ncbi:helix-turn-helix domain-containing protein [Microbispora sp. NPDC088329]|uniref:helix-turn-helix domain-containing protein n=1 Tax=Microbispora sp. NPDC088329 TaxID=3154869 RepID=UPI00343F0678
MAQSNELGDFLRARRARLRPDQVGLPGTVGRRRTPGLRREELAALAGLSVDYYIRLEQGRERNPSPAVVHALASALHLDADETAHLHALTHHAAGRRPRPSATSPAAPPAVAALLDRLRPWPALVLARNGDVLAANPEGLALYAGLDSRHDVRPRRGGAKTFRHPAAGDLVLSHQSRHLDDSSVRLSLYQPEPGCQDRLHLLTLGADAASSPR